MAIRYAATLRSCMRRIRKKITAAGRKMISSGRTQFARPMATPAKNIALRLPRYIRHRLSIAKAMKQSSVRAATTSPQMPPIMHTKMALRQALCSLPVIR